MPEIAVTSQVGGEGGGGGGEGDGGVKKDTKAVVGIIYPPPEVRSIRHFHFITIHVS